MTLNNLFLSLWGKKEEEEEPSEEQEQLYEKLQTSFRNVQRSKSSDKASDRRANFQSKLKKSSSFRHFQQQPLISLTDLNRKFLKSTYNKLYVLIGLGVYLLIGFVAYSQLEDWTIFDTFFFLIVTMTTVGYGDIVPDSKASRLFTSFYLLVGLWIMGFLFGAVVSFKADNKDQFEKIKSMKAFAEKHRKEAKAKSKSKSEAKQDGEDEEVGEGEGEGEEKEEGKESELFPPTVSNSNSNDFEELREYLVRNQEEELIQLRKELFKKLALMVLLLLVGMFGMMILQEWNAIDAFYWSTATITTVGYGDLVPDTELARLFNIIFVLFGCTLMASSLTDLVNYPIRSKIKRNEMRVLNQFQGDLSVQQLESIFNSDLFRVLPEFKATGKELGRIQFSLLVLKLMERVDEQDLLLISKLFDKLDITKTGTITEAEQLLHTERAQLAEEEEQSRE